MSKSNDTRVKNIQDGLLSEIKRARDTAAGTGEEIYIVRKDGEIMLVVLAWFERPENASGKTLLSVDSAGVFTFRGDVDI